MATITPTFAKTRGPTGGIDAMAVTWTPMATGDVGANFGRPDYADRTIQFTGTFGGATAVLEGSNDGVNFFTLNDPVGNALSFTAAALKQIAEATAFVRPHITGGGGVTITAILMARRTLR